jgi:hypothetical protein
MSVILFGVPGKLKQLLTRVPANNAAQIAKLDDTISSRAPAGTAVSNAVLTPAKVGLLDNLDAAISTLETDTSANGRATILATLVTSNSVIKKVIHTYASKFGPGYAYSSYFPSSYVVDRDKTFIVPLAFGSDYYYKWQLAATNNRVQFEITGGGSVAHTGYCIVVEFK